MDTVLNKNHYLFTSESVGEGHPDKLCDQISDSILDYCLTLDSEAHVACETFATTNFVLVGGEIRFLKQDINLEELNTKIEEIARGVAKNIGYDSEDKGLDYKTFTFMNRLHAQSDDICQGVVGTQHGSGIHCTPGPVIGSAVANGGGISAIIIVQPTVSVRNVGRHTRIISRLTQSYRTTAL